VRLQERQGHPAATHHAGAVRQAAGNKTDLLENFVSNKTRRKFKAFLSWDAKAGKVGFEFEPRAPRAAAKKAPARKAA